VGRIEVLPPLVQGQIAAGEVVERPASVVKELVENALDAGARNVDVRIVAGGLERIVVRDDGEGMAPDDALLAFARHATSKLRRVEDLADVATLGFRGEALPSIAAVARVRVTSRRPGDAGAVAVAADAAGVRSEGRAGAAPGTTVEVRELFATTPARRKFLRSAATEAGHVSEAVTRLAVAHPVVGFRVEHDGRELLALPPVRDLHQRLGQVLGRARATRMLPVEAGADGWTLAGALLPPAESLSSARLLWTYVALGPGPAAGGGRWVRDRLLIRAVLDGYASLLMRGRYPVTVLFVRAPAGEVDVNVHPAKLEVRFRRPDAVHRLIVPALRARLRAGLAAGGEAPAVGEGAPRYGGAAVGALPAARDATAAPAPEVPAMPFRPAPAPSHAGEDAPGLWAAAPRGFRALRFVGQVLDGFLVCEDGGRVVLIDQHAAHERVVFERLRAERRAAAIARDPLLVPETIELPPAHVAALAEHVGTLAAAGLEGEAFGPGTWLLRTVPRALHGRDVGGVLRAVAAELAEEGASAAAERALDAVCATVACHSVVRLGQRLEAREVEALLASMDDVPIAAHCPHGRPVAVELTRAQLEALFRR
jgi:DNA mismatch repair protein MutL